MKRYYIKPSFKVHRIVIKPLLVSEALSEPSMYGGDINEKGTDAGNSLSRRMGSIIDDDFDDKIENEERVIFNLFY